MKFPFVFRRTSETDLVALKNKYEIQLATLETKVAEREQKEVELKGFISSLSSILVEPDKSVSFVGLLSFSQMWRIYKQCALVRAAVDTRIDEIVSLPWRIQPKEKDEKLVDDATRDHAKEVQSFMDDPNLNDEPFARVLAMFLRDLLVYDAGVLVKRKSLSNKLVELVALDGSTFRPVVSRHGIIEKYIQETMVEGETKKENFDNDEVVYISCNPSTHSAYGLSPLESLVNEVAADLYISAHQAKYWEENEIPEGILMMKEEMSEVSYKRLMASLKKWKAHEFAINILDGAGDAKWLPFKLSSKETQLLVLQDYLMRKICAVYKMTPNELGFTEKGLNRATAVAQMEVQKRKSLVPLLRLLEYHFNTEIISEFYPDIEFKFTPRWYENATDTLKEAQAVTEKLNTGFAPIDELRVEQGKTPYRIEGVSDSPFFMTRQGPIFLRDLQVKAGEGPPRAEGGDGEGEAKSEEAQDFLMKLFQLRSSVDEELRKRERIIS